MGGDIGVRTIQHQDCSPLSGNYVIEDVQGDDRRYFRRLIFLSNRNVVQSEARLLQEVSHRGEGARAWRWDLDVMAWARFGVVRKAWVLGRMWDRLGTCGQRYPVLWALRVLVGISRVLLFVPFLAKSGSEMMSRAVKPNKCDNHSFKRASVLQVAVYVFVYYFGRLV